MMSVRKTRRRSRAQVVARKLVHAVLTRKQRKAGHEVMRRLVARQYVLSSEVREMGEKCKVNRRVVDRALDALERKEVIKRINYGDAVRWIPGLPALTHRPPVVYVSNVDRLVKYFRGCLRGLEALSDEMTSPSFVDTDPDADDYLFVVPGFRPMSKGKKRVAKK